MNDSTEEYLSRMAESSKKRDKPKEDAPISQELADIVKHATRDVDISLQIECTTCSATCNGSGSTDKEAMDELIGDLTNEMGADPWHIVDGRVFCDRECERSYEEGN